MSIEIITKYSKSNTTTKKQQITIAALHFDKNNTNKEITSQIHP